MISWIEEEHYKQIDKRMKRLKSRHTKERIFTLDLHGLPTKEAKIKLSQAIDRCFYNRYNKIRVIHGNGSGKLKEMTFTEAHRNELVRSVGVCFTDEGHTDLILEERDT